MVQWLRFFHDHHSLYITTAYCILMRRFYKKFLSEKIFHWFVYFVVSFRSIRVNIFTVNITRGYSKSTFIEESGEEGGVRRSLKSQEKRTGGGGSIACVYVLFLKKNAEISMTKFYSSSFIVFLLIIMALWNIKQIIMKEYNIQSCQWMACNSFFQPKKDQHNVGYVKNIYLQPFVVG